MATRKKTRTLWQSIIRVTVGLLTLLSVGLLWIFAGIFSFPFWKFLMGILAGIIIRYIYEKD
jgi:putative flippase GtrA